MPWSESIFTLAQNQDKPILLSIGYAACHWCHVMERESFEDELVAAYMNEHFINVKVDREERPDVDQIYMDALQAMTGSGGWPLNIFLLPDGRPFYGGTYFPPRPVAQRASWSDVLKGVSEGYTNNKEKIIEQAKALTQHIVQSNIKQIVSSIVDDNDTLATKEEFGIMADRILMNADIQWGGFGAAPKFPQTFTIQTLLRNYLVNNHQASLYHALLSLDKMIQGGIYDVLGGGFARYSTDAQWQAPHFEKMLYDNAFLLSVLSEAYQITEKKEYKIVIEQTIAFLDRELSNGKAYFAALDADSEGVEGKFYTWTYEEIQALIPNEVMADFCDYYQIKKEGNWEHTNILWTHENFLKGQSEEFIKAKELLFSFREKRIRPGLDHKIILSWNSFMVTALCKSYAAIGNEQYKSKAIHLMSWIEDNFFNATDHFYYHTITNGVKKSFAFLDDYASLIQGYIHLQEITGNVEYLKKAKKLTEYVIEHFGDEEGVFFYYTADYQKDILLRKKESYDGAQPSGNALMCYNLLYLSAIFSKSNWEQRSQQMIKSMRRMILQYPSSFGCWNQSFLLHSEGFTELVALVGEEDQRRPLLLAKYLPLKILLFYNEFDPEIGLLEGREGIENQYFICKNKTCSAPISEWHEFLALI
jgi:uncharacterized protein YyaL (SSP411 family)